MVTEVSVLQFSKALFPIVVTLFGMVTEVRELQFEKARSPISVTLFNSTEGNFCNTIWNGYRG